MENNLCFKFKRVLRNFLAPYREVLMKATILKLLGIQRKPVRGLISDGEYEC